MNKLRNLDAYPKINEDFYSRTLSGGVITLASSIVMFLLFFSELRKSISSYVYTHTRARELFNFLYRSCNFGCLLKSVFLGSHSILNQYVVICAAIHICVCPISFYSCFISECKFSNRACRIAAIIWWIRM